MYDDDINPETGQATALPEPMRYGPIHSLEAMLDRYSFLRQGEPTKELLDSLDLFEITKDTVSQSAR